VAAAGQKIGFHAIGALDCKVALLEIGGEAFELNGALRQPGLGAPALGDIEFDAIPDNRAIGLRVA